MRLWMVEPKNLCNQHLLGEHQEVHMAAGCIVKGWQSSLSGLAKTGKMEVQSIVDRHAALEAEMLRRNMTPVAPFPDVEGKLWNEGHVLWSESIVTLYIRCEGCRERIGERAFNAALRVMTSEVYTRILKDEEARRLEGKSHANLELLESFRKELEGAYESMP